MRLLTVPDLPPFDESKAITLVQAIAHEYVPKVRGRRMNREKLRRWAKSGKYMAPGVAVLFPARLVGHHWLTMPEHCLAFTRFVGRLQAVGV